MDTSPGAPPLAAANVGAVPASHSPTASHAISMHAGPWSGLGHGAGITSGAGGAQGEVALLPQASGSGRSLPPDVQACVLSFLPPNDLALGGRLSCKEAAQRFSSRHHRTACIRQPLPGHAATATWCVEGAEATMTQQLTFRQKLLLLSTAAASGCEANLDFAWQLLQPCLFPELLRTSRHYSHILSHSGCSQQQQQQQQQREEWGDDPATAAARAGHPPLLRWLLRRCPSVLQPASGLVAATRHCDLAGLQAAWGLLRSHVDKSAGVEDRALQAAAGSPSSTSALAKMEWLLEVAMAAVPGGQRCILRKPTAAAAAASGDVLRLEWLKQRGCPMDAKRVLAAALQHADLGVAEWLVGEAGVALPGPEDPRAAAVMAEAAAAAAEDGVSKLRWLEAQGVEVGGPGAVVAAAEAGRVQTVAFLQERCGPGVLTWNALRCSAGSRSVPTATWLRAAGCPLTFHAYAEAFAAGDVAMVAWLAREARCPAEGVCVGSLVRRWPQDRTAPRPDAAVGEVAETGGGDGGGGGASWGASAVTAECSGVAKGDGDGLVQAVRLLVEDGGARVRDVGMAFGRAAARGDLPLVRYLAEGAGCGAAGGTWAWEALPAAAGSGCVPLVEWLAEVVRGPGAGAGAGTQGGSSSGGSTAHCVGVWDRCYAAAGANGDRGTLACLRRIGAPVGEGTLAAAAGMGCTVPVLQWLEGQGARAGEEQLRAAVGAVEGARGGQHEGQQHVVVGLHAAGLRGAQARRVLQWLRGRLAQAAVAASAEKER